MWLLQAEVGKIASAVDPEVRAAYRALAKEAEAAAGEMLELTEALLQQNPAGESRAGARGCFSRGLHAACCMPSAG